MNIFKSHYYDSLLYFYHLQIFWDWMDGIVTVNHKTVAVNRTNGAVNATNVQVNPKNGAVDAKNPPSHHDSVDISMANAYDN